jgi:membrane glycosyltransferase
MTQPTSDHQTGERHATAPPIDRTPMRARPWFGLLRGAMAALLPGLQFFWGLHNPPGWVYAAERRRRALLLVVLLFGSMALALLASSAPDQPSVAWMLYAALGTLMLAWVGAGAATALMGAMVLLRGDRNALTLREPRAPIDKRARTAVIMPVCNEDIATVFSGLRATCESIAATGTLGLFDFYLLSDSTDPAVRAAELRAWERLRALLGDNPIGAGARVFYRWRRLRRMRKAGNVADFCRRWGKHYRYMVVLDADSTMHGHALVSLVRLMEQHPTAGIVQTLPQPYGHDTLHARVQQFATRVTGRLFALGLSYWQLGDSHYWGHNAILRVEPFMRHCALAPIRGRGSLAGDILSHDFVEAAMMRRAGYEVWLAPQLEGSWEQLPPNLLDELGRDRRWCRGNLQNAQLIAEPGWRPVHRAMFGIGALSYLMGPLWLLFVALGYWISLKHNGNAAPQDGVALWALTLSLLLMPRVLGALCVCWRREQVQYGGTWRLWMSVALEMVVSALQAPVRMLAHTAYVLSAFTGLRLEWRSPQREASGVAWRDAFARLGLLCVPLLALSLLALWAVEPAPAAPQLALMVLPLLLAVPLTVLGSHAGFGTALRRLRVLLVPEERQPPRALRHAIEQRGFADLVPPRMATPMATSVVARQTVATAMSWWGRGMAASMSAAVIAVVAFTPRLVATPEMPEGLRLQSDIRAAMNALPRLEMPMLLATATDAVTKPRTARERPARRIDNAVRERARDAVQRAIAVEAYEPVRDM